MDTKLFYILPCKIQLACLLYVLKGFRMKVNHVQILSICFHMQFIFLKHFFVLWNYFTTFIISKPSHQDQLFDMVEEHGFQGKKTLSSSCFCLSSACQLVYVKHKFFIFKKYDRVEKWLQGGRTLLSAQDNVMN